MCEDGGSKRASKRGDTALVSFLMSQGAKEQPILKRKPIPGNHVPEEATAREMMTRDAVPRAVDLLPRSSDGFLDHG